jgi:DNA modification methylase
MVQQSLTAQYAEQPIDPAVERAPDLGRGGRLSVRVVSEFERLLVQMTGLDRSLSGFLIAAVDDVIQQLGPVEADEHEVSSQFYGRVNQKLMASRDVLRDIYGLAAACGLTFNYPTKLAIAWAVDSGNAGMFRGIVASEAQHDAALVENLMARFRPVPQHETRELIVAETRKPTKLRKAHERDVVLDVFEAAAGPLLWSLWPARALHDVFQPPATRRQYTGDYMVDLRAEQPTLFDRGRALVAAIVRPGEGDYAAQRAELAGWIASEYERLDNYGFVAVLLDCEEQPTRAWELSADLTLFAERFDEYPLSKPFFRSDEVARETIEHVPHLELDRARFDLINEGFTYRDLFVLADSEGQVRRLLLLFQKNRRDETLLPCPACRSSDVAGNSYPSLGVKSWECRNPLCPQRSIYNRGKRYSFKALLQQAAIEHPENAIPVNSVRRWQRDVLEFVDDADVLDMLVRHYSMAGDAVVLLDWPESSYEALGRTVVRESRAANHPDDGFWREAAYFARYAVATQPLHVERGDSEIASVKDRWKVLQGDAHDVLAGIPDNTFARAVTSPPYFNAREYAQWPNLYCYLFDMQRINSQVFRTLKPGALYAYNIFDYFDNERTIVFSAMGRKRITLSAAMVDLFRRIGFEFAGAVVWDKGEIHGKRGFNAGNFSPFYQSPFNCWEHVLVLRKPAEFPHVGDTLDELNRVMRIHPVVKMVRGENTLGHTAPFPVELPQAVLQGLPPDALVLDPFAGSGTTGRAAIDGELRAVLIERDPEYAELGRRLLRRHEAEVCAETQTLW